MYRGFFQSFKEAVKRFLSNRILVVGIVLIPLAFLLFGRLFHLQIIRGNDYYENYVNTTRKEVSIPAIRGNIYDRNGVLLAGNKVVYSVTVTDDNYYPKASGAFNEMLLRLVHLLDGFDVKYVDALPVTVDSNGEFAWSGSDRKRRTFIRDVYSRTRIEQLAEEGIDAYQYDAETVMKYLMGNLYNFTSRWEGAEAVSKEDALKICNIRYALSATAYTRYIPTVVVSDASPEVQAAVLESQDQMNGVNIEETYVRDYKNSECFSSVLGYVGSITTEEIEELNAGGGDYIAGDIIGKEGIESAYESYLQGTKGTKTIYVNNTGIVLSEEVTSAPVQGNDIYLSIDANATIAAYHIIEQQLAGIIVNHLYEGNDYDPLVAYEKAEYLIPIRDVYFQMINNNILSMEAFSDQDASDAETAMKEKLEGKKQEVVAFLKSYMDSRSETPLSSQTSFEQAYISWLYTYMADKGYLLTSAIDREDEVYAAYKAREISLPRFLIYALQSGWVDVSSLGEDERYNSIDSCYRFLTDMLLEKTRDQNGSFDKLVYDELIHTDAISGCDVAEALFRQNVLKKDEEARQRLSGGDNQTAFDFFKEKITSMEILPAQIALDPCSAGLVLTDPLSGELLTVVSYPSYDANRINDSAYYNRLLNDLSSPLYSRATQSRLAPGSTYKMVTSVAALEEGYIRPDEEIYCAGIFDKLDHPRCWIYRLQNGEHGDLDVRYALGQSCNCFFYECGYRFSQNALGQYSPSQGISVLNKYSALFGFGSLTGIETTENVSILTNELPILSAIGQGTNAFTTISLARYVSAIASSGNLYEFKYLDHITDISGETILSHTPEVVSHIELKPSTWDLIHNGMYTVVHEGGSRNGDFATLQREYAAKSGSAQENRLRAEHGWYVTYGPYDDISYAMAIQIPNGYSSGNAALIAKDVYQFLEGDITLEEIMENSASSGQINNVGE